MRMTSLPLLATSLTTHPLSISLVPALGGLPWLLFSPVAGAFIDRHDRRRLMLLGQIARGITIAFLATWIIVGTPPLAALYLVALVVGAGEVLVDNTSQAAVPHLAPPGPGGLDAANGRLLGAQTLANGVVGAPLGAAAFAAGAALPFIFDTLTFALCAVLLALIHTPLQTERTRATTSVLADVRTGFVALWASPMLRRLAFAGGAFNLCLSGAYAVFVLLVTDAHSGSSGVYGVMLAIGAIGGLIGAMTAGRAARAVGRGPALVASTSVAGAGLVGLGLAPSLAVVAPLNLITLAAMVTSSVLSQSVRQASTSDELLGRVVASFRMIGFAGIPVGGALAGLIATATSVRTTFVIAGVATILPVIGIIAAVHHLDSDIDQRPT